MKSILFYLAILTLAITSSCGSDDDSKPFTCGDCVDSPEASAAFDASSKGIYKGVVIGSSGIIKFDVANEGSDITATLVIDDQSIALSSNVTWEEGETLTAVFTGSLNDQAVSITLYINGDGGYPEVGSITIPGHPDASIVVIKEKSDELVKCFEGEYSGSSSGTFNMVLSEELGEWYAIARDNESDFTSSSGGIVQGSALTGSDSQGDVLVTGKVSSDEVSGKWESSDGEGSWKGKRSL